MAEVHWGALETTLKSIIRNLLYEVMAMFDKEYSFKGIHADKVNELTKDFDNSGNKLFVRNLDVYILAPIVGFLYQRMADVDNTPDIKPTKVFGDILMKNADQLMSFMRN